jgi:hypothetical protein
MFKRTRKGEVGQQGNRGHFASKTNTPVDDSVALLSDPGVVMLGDHDGGESQDREWYPALRTKPHPHGTRPRREMVHVTNPDFEKLTGLRVTTDGSVVTPPPPPPPPLPPPPLTEEEQNERGFYRNRDYDHHMQRWTEGDSFTSRVIADQMQPWIHKSSPEFEARTRMSVMPDGSVVPRPERQPPTRETLFDPEYEQQQNRAGRFRSQTKRYPAGHRLEGHLTPMFVHKSDPDFRDLTGLDPDAV